MGRRLPPGRGLPGRPPPGFRGKISKMDAGASDGSQPGQSAWRGLMAQQQRRTCSTTYASNLLPRPLMAEHHFALHKDEITCVAALDDPHVVSASADGHLRIWNARVGTCVHHLAEHTGRVRCLTLLSGHMLASGSDDRTIRLWCVSPTLKYESHKPPPP